MGELKDMSTPFRKYLNQDKVYVSPAVLGLVDTHIIGVMLQTDPLLTFRDNIKASIMDIMNDDTPISVFAKRVREINPSNDKPRFTNGLAIQVVIEDGKKLSNTQRNSPKQWNMSMNTETTLFFPNSFLSRSDRVPPLTKTPFAASFECRMSSFTTLNMLNLID
jgi:hypothetical protein